MVRRDPLLLQAINLLSQTVAKNEKFYSETSCLNPEEREILGYIKAYRTLFGEEDSTSKMLQFFGKAIKYIGISRWPRTELTDLGLNIGESDRETVDFFKALEEEGKSDYSDSEGESRA